MTDNNFADSFKLNGKFFFSRYKQSDSKTGGVKGPYWYVQPIEKNVSGKWPQVYVGVELNRPGKTGVTEIVEKRRQVEEAEAIARAVKFELERRLAKVEQFLKTYEHDDIETVKTMALELGLTEAGKTDDTSAALSLAADKLTELDTAKFMAMAENDYAVTPQELRSMAEFLAGSELAQPEPQPDKKERNRLARERERTAIAEAKSHLLSLDYESCPETIKGKWDSTAAVEILRENGWQFIAEGDFQTGFWLLKGTMKRSEIGNMWREAYKMVRLNVLKSRQDQN